MKNLVFKLLAGRLGGVIGRRNLVRIGTFLARAGRQDIPNSISANGEALVQKTILKRLYGSEAIIIDCGANIGQWSTQLITVARKTDKNTQLKLFCFEPSFYSYSKLTKALSNLQSSNLNLSAYQKALSSKSGNLSLKIVHGGAGTNSLVEVPGSYAEEETVSVTTMDDFAAENEIVKIDFLKIDAEGHDFDVILGAEQLLNEHCVGVIQFEYNWRWIYGKHFLQEVFEFLKQRGYDLGKITPEGIQFYSEYDVQLESFVEGNYLACTSQWRGQFGEVPNWLD